MLKRIPEILIQPFPHWGKIDFFRKILYLLLLLNAISLLPVFLDLFGYDGIVGSGGWDSKTPWYSQGSKAFVHVLSHPANSKYYWVVYIFVFGQLGALITGLLNIWPRVSSILVYFFTVNLFLKGYLFFTGGEVLVSILLFYLIFVQKSKSKKEERAKPYFTPLQNVLNNTFYWVMLIQVCLLYFFSTLYKLTDPYWVSGDAMMYIARVEGFSSSAMRFLFADNPIISMLVTYMVLLYQGLFSVLVWVKRIKIPFLLFGVFFHLAISFGMGIFTFGIIMSVAYLLFLDQKQIEWIKRKLPFIK